MCQVFGPLGNFHSQSCPWLSLSLKNFFLLMPDPSLLRKDAVYILCEGLDSLKKGLSVLLDTSSLCYMKSQSTLDEFLTTSLLHPLRSEYDPRHLVKTMGKT